MNEKEIMEMEKSGVTKIVSKCSGGDGRFYGRISLPKRYIGKIMLIRIASKDEIKRLDNVFGRVDSEDKIRIKNRKEKLDNHLNKLRKIRAKRKKEKLDNHLNELREIKSKEAKKK